MLVCIFIRLAKKYMSKKKISLITTCYNAANFLEEAVLSVTKSIITDFEIEHVIIDDASTDTTKKIIKQLPLANPVKLYNKKNLGVSKSRNRAIRASTGDYIYILDADDILLQNSLKYLFEAIDDNKIDWVYGDHITVNKKLSYILGQDFYGQPFATPQQVLLAVFTNKHFFQQTSLFTRKIFDHVGGYNEALRTGEDVDLFIRFLLHKCLPKFVPVTTHLRRVHGKNLSLHYLQDHNFYFRDLRYYFETYENNLKLIVGVQQTKKISAFIKRIAINS